MSLGGSPKIITLSSEYWVHSAPNHSFLNVDCWHCKIILASIFCRKILKINGFGRLSSSFSFAISFGGESEGTPGLFSFQKYGLILVWPGCGPPILSGLSSPANSLKSTHASLRILSGNLVVRSALQPTSGYEPPRRTVGDTDAIG